MNEKIDFDVVVVGGGAAGLMAASVVASQGKSVIVLEASDTWAAKVCVSGGGKCNFSNAEIAADNYVSQNVHFCKSALARYRSDDFKKLLEKNQIDWEIRADGKMFSFSGRKIAEMLVAEARKAGAVLKLNTPVVRVTKTNVFHVETAQKTYIATKVIIATGGLSFPKLGANESGYKIATGFGMSVVSLVPGLTGFILTPNPFEELSGVSLPVMIQLDKRRLQGDMLFTHKGLSGPVIFNASLYWNAGQKIGINFLPDMPVDIWSRGKTFGSALSTVLPKKFVTYLLGDKDRDIANATKQEKQFIINRVTAFEIVPSMLEGYHKAEVTRGGVSTNDINSTTMESKKNPGLYFVGEVVDVTGQLGGYNLHWAWASGYAAGIAIGGK